MKAGRQVIDTIKLCYSSDLPCLLIGKHGTSKTSLLEQAAREMGIEHVTLDLSLCEAVDLQGIPTVRDGVTVYNPPALLPREGKGLLSLEEINRAGRDVMAPAMLLLSSRTLNSYRLPPGWLPVGSINPSSDGYDVNEMDAALRSRFVNITVEADVREWLKWAEQNEVHPAVCRYVRGTPNIFESAESNPRAWTYVSSMIRSYEQGDMRDEGLLATAVSGLVGETLGVSFVQQLLTGEEPLTASQIFDDYDKHRPTVRRWAKVKRVDLLNATAVAVMVSLQCSDTAARVEESMMAKGNLDEFTNRLPADLKKKVLKSCKDAGVKI